MTEVIIDGKLYHVPNNILLKLGLSKEVSWTKKKDLKELLGEIEFLMGYKYKKSFFHVYNY